MSAMTNRGRGLVPYGRQLALPGAAGMDWDALRDACASAWPEAQWKHEPLGSTHLWARRGGRTIAMVSMTTTADELRLTVFLDMPKSMHGSWSMIADASCASTDGATFAALVMQGRALWKKRS